MPGRVVFTRQIIMGMIASGWILFINVRILLYFVIFIIGCKGDSKTVESEYHYLKPHYQLVHIYPTTDTLKFPLDENSFNDIQSFNLFTHKKNDYISFCDQRSGTINIYNFHTQQLEKKINLKSSFAGKRLYKTTAFVKNLDSIFVTNNRNLYILNNAGTITKSFSFLKHPAFAWAHFKSTNPPVFINNNLYIGVRPYVKVTSQSDLKEWRVMYRFDLSGNEKQLYYNLPKNYQEHLYGYYFMDYNYCYNNHGRYVFSFPADTNIYETNLTNYHRAYFAKSRFQNDRIQPVDKEHLSKTENEFKSYLVRDSYGVIYFDHYKKRYLRVFKGKISDDDYKNKIHIKNQRLIVFDENLQIIGDARISNNISLNTIFFTPDGRMYARINSRDEYNINFVRLVYNDDNSGSSQLTKK